MTTPRKRGLTPSMVTAIKSLLYIRADDTVAIHCYAYGFKVTAADVAKVRRTQPATRIRRAGYIKPSVSADSGMGQLNDFMAHARDASAKLLERIRAAYPGGVPC